MKQASTRVMDEMENACRARAAGNAPRSRVSARRAAGWAARDYLAAHGLPTPPGALAALKVLAVSPELAPDLRQAALQLTAQVDREFQLPAGVDLVEAALKLIGGLK